MEQILKNKWHELLAGPKFIMASDSVRDISRGYHQDSVNAESFEYLVSIWLVGCVEA